MIVYRHYTNTCNCNDNELCELLNKINLIVDSIFYLQEYSEINYGILIGRSITYNYELFKKIMIDVDKYNLPRYGYYIIPNIYTKREVMAYLNGIYYGLTFNN